MALRRATRRSRSSRWTTGASTLWLVRSQTTVQDISYMRAMIPHHSIAILTSERSEITDLRVPEFTVANGRDELSVGE